MKVVAARLNHETNTFSPVPTPLASFGPNGPSFGAAAYDSARGTRTALGAFVDACEARGVELVVPVNATANPSGRVDAGAFERLAGAIVAAVQGGCDAILLDLHGAMATTDCDDGEGELLRRLRTVAPRTPLVVALDLHANVTRAMVDRADAIVGFKTYPHVDMVDTGAHAARLLFDWIERGERPRLAWAQLPLLSHTLMTATREGAMRRAVERARALEATGLLAATVFGGFSLADIGDAGVSVVTVGQTQEAAQEAAGDLAALLWSDRSGFVYAGAPLAESVSRALAARSARGPVLLLDHGDNVMSGGTCDTTDVLEECLRQGMTGIGVGPICDPATVDAAIAAGVGASARFELGNRLPFGPGHVRGGARSPMGLEARVIAITDGRFRITGPIYTGEVWTMGRTAVLEHDACTVVVSERPMEPLDVGVFTGAGIDPSTFDYLILKSRMYCRPSFEPIASSIVECDSRGVTSSDYGLFRFERLRRPIYPLDVRTPYP